MYACMFINFDNSACFCSHFTLSKYAGRKIKRKRKKKEIHTTTTTHRRALPLSHIYTWNNNRNPLKSEAISLTKWLLLNDDDDDDDGNVDGDYFNGDSIDVAVKRQITTKSMSCQC